MAVLGDIAIVGYDSDTSDATNNPRGKSFSFVLLADLSGQTINFTDNGWTAAGAFRTGEGVVSYVVPANTAIGTVVTISGLTGSFNPSTVGDQIIAYTGTATSPTFLFAVDFADGNATYAGDATTANTSAVPTGLTFGDNALAFAADNASYTGPTTGTKEQILAAIADENNWTQSETSAPPYPASFTVSAGGGPGSFSIANASVNEGAAGATTPITFTVSRSGGSTGAATVAYSFANGTTDAADFATAPASGTLLFADGETSKTITYQIAGDATFEPSETFTVKLDSTTAGTIGTGTATGTIVNDDAAPAGSLSIAGASVVEGNAGVTPIEFVVTRTGGSAGTVTANYAASFTGTANAADLSGATSGTVTFLDGETTKTVTLGVVGDTTFEPNETFAVTLSNPTGGATITTSSATGTITNDDAAPPPAPLFINEIHYDNFGTDTGEAIEIAGPAGTDLTGWTVVLYNGNGGAAYDTKALTGVIADQNNGYGTAVVTYATNGIQNGSPDAIALVAPGGQVVQFLSYEGVFAATTGPAAGMTSTEIGVSEESAAIGYSLQLTGAGATYADFTWAQAAQNTFGSAYSPTSTTTSQFAGAINTGQSFLPTNGPGYLRITAASVAEGDSGTATMTFSVTRSGGSAAAASVDYALAFTGSATASDLAPGTPLSGTLSFAVGETVKTISVGVVGDTVAEPNETFSIQLANPGGNTFLTDASGVGTILNDDPIALAIYEIQGAALQSGYVGQRVTTTGVVTAVGNGGFYIQDATGDGNAATSDAIFVATSARASVAVGNTVTVNGTIAEAGASGALTVTQFAAGAAVTVTAATSALPTAVVIGHDGLHPPTSVIDDDNLSSYDPQTDGIDFYESLEGMRVAIDAPLVVARTDGGDTWVVASGGVDATGVSANGAITIAAGDYNPEKILLDSASDIFGGFSGSCAQGDRLSTVEGIMTYGSAYYRVAVTGAVTQTFDANLQPEVTNLVGDATHLTIASFNMENADVSDGAAKFNLLASNVVYNLRAPDIIFAQEIQDADGAGSGTDYSGTVTANAVISAITAIGGPSYSYVEIAPTANNQNGGEPNGNIRNGFFYRSDRVSYIADSATLITGAAFDGSRKPLVADFSFNGHVVTAVDVHSTSRLGSTALFGSTQPPIDAGDGARTAQANAIKAYVDGLLASNADHNIVVAGDFNGFYFEPALLNLGSNGLSNVSALIPVEERYSYVFEGNAQQIDNMFASGRLMQGAAFDAVHINTVRAAGEAMATDHDQIVARFALPPNAAPVGVGDAIGVDEDATSDNLYAALLSNDSDPDAGTTLKIVGVGTAGTLGTVVFDAATQTLRYVADADAFDTLRNGATTTDTFTYTVSDGKLQSTATVTMTVTGIADVTTTNGTSQADTIVGNGGDERIYGNAGNDVLSGDGGADFISAGLGNDLVYGDAGRDYLLGGAGLDTIYGGDGNDYISGEAGNDLLFGGAGADTFAFGQSGGRDTIADFDTASDTILLANKLAFQSSSVGDVNGDGIADLTLVFASGSSAVLLGVSSIDSVTIVRSPDPLVTIPQF